MISLPVHMSLVLPSSETAIFPSYADLVLTAFTSWTLYTQWTADNQQYSFQNYKSALQKIADSDSSADAEGTEKGKKSLATTSDLSLSQETRQWTQEFSLNTITWTPLDASRGFVTRGLWAWSRHPNFACEQIMWTLQALFAVFAANGSLSEETKAKMLLPNPLIASLAVSSIRQYRLLSICYRKDRLMPSQLLTIPALSLHTSRPADEHALRRLYPIHRIHLLRKVHHLQSLPSRRW